MENNRKIYQKFFDALNSSDVDSINTLIKEKKIGVNSPIGDQTPLACAIDAGQYDIVKALIEYGASINISDDIVPSHPLIKVFLSGKPEIVKLLLENRAVHHITNDLIIPALQRPNVEIITMILEKIDDVRILNDKPQNIPWELLLILDKDNIIMPKLVERGLNIDQVLMHSVGTLSAITAIQLGYSSAFEQLFYSNIPEEIDYMLFDAVFYNQLDIAKMLLVYPMVNNIGISDSYLSHPITKRNIQMIEILLKNTVSISPDIIREALLSSNLEIVKLFVEQNVDFRGFVKEHNIPWKLLSVLDDKKTVMQFLADQGLTEATIDESDTTSLQHAVKHHLTDALKVLLGCIDRQRLNDIDIIGDMLIEYDSFMERDYSSLYSKRAKVQKTLATLKECQYRITSEDINIGIGCLIKPDEAEILEMCVDMGLYTNTRLEEGNTYLTYAIACNALNTITVLLNAGIDVTAINDIGYHAAEYAAMLGKHEIMMEILKHTIINEISLTRFRNNYGLEADSDLIKRATKEISEAIVEKRNMGLQDACKTVILSCRDSNDSLDQFLEKLLPKAGSVPGIKKAIEKCLSIESQVKQQLGNLLCNTRLESLDVSQAITHEQRNLQ